MRIAIASDHAAFALKAELRDWLTAQGHEVSDLGPDSEASVDYPDYARKVGDEVASGHVDQGLLVCGSGTGMAIAANKVPGVRAAVAWNEETARLARQHNDANVLCIGARFIPADEAARMIRVFMETEFDGGRHAERVEKLTKLDESR